MSAFLLGSQISLRILISLQTLITHTGQKIYEKQEMATRDDDIFYTHGLTMTQSSKVANFCGFRAEAKIRKPHLPGTDATMIYHQSLQEKIW